MLLQELGADVAVDYTKNKFDQVFKDEPFDVVVDSVGGRKNLREKNIPEFRSCLPVQANC